MKGSPPPPPPPPPLPRPGIPTREELRGRPVTVMGLGLFGGGVAVARWLTGAGARVTVTDLRGPGDLAPALEEIAGLGLRLVLGEHRDEDFQGKGVALVVASPAVAPHSPWLVRARRAGVPVTSELELFLAHCPAPVVAITGTQGKSSTAHMLAQLLARAGRPVRLGGNIGAPLLAEVDGIGPAETCVVEVSSYQLEALAGPPRPAGVGPGVVAVAVTNLLVDHLERHGSPAAYAAAKARVLELLAPGGGAWLPAALRDSPTFALPPGRTRTLFGGRGSDLTLEERGGRFRRREEHLGALGDLALPGAFQGSNALLALGLARGLGVPAAELAAGVAGLVGLPHRMQELAPVAGRRVVDNAVSTTPESTLAALVSVSGPCTLVLGGQAKRGLDYRALARAAAGSRAPTRAVAFGAAAGELVDTLTAAGVEVRGVDTLEEAVTSALEVTPPGGTLLFSPACASFDAYPNFQSRALAFRRALGSRSPAHEPGPGPSPPRP